MIPAAMPASAGTRAMNGSTPVSVRGAALAGDAAFAEQVRTEDREDDHQRLEQQPPGRRPADDLRVATRAARRGQGSGRAGGDEDERRQDRHGDRGDQRQAGRPGRDRAGRRSRWPGSPAAG